MRLIILMLALSLMGCGSVNNTPQPTAEVASGEAITCQSNNEVELLKLEVKRLETELKNYRKNTYSNETIHDWSAEIIYNYFKDEDAQGSWDICWDHKAEGWSGLTDEYPVEVQNACAIELSGAEY